MAKIGISTLVLFLVAGISLFSLQHKTYAVSCDAIVGDWAWFTGGNVTLNAEGTITSKESGNLGTWECTNTTTGVFTLRWVFGNPPFVDTLTLSVDGKSLSGKNQFQYPVTANRITTAKKVAPKESQKVTPEESQELLPWLNWKFDANRVDDLSKDYRWFSPTVAGGVVYVGSGGGYLYAIDIKTHQEEWKFKTGGNVRTSPAVADNLVYVGTDDDILFALDAITGKEKWRFKTGGINGSSPVVADGVVYIGSTDTYLYAVDSKTGVEKWKFKTGGKFFSSPAVADNVVYIGSTDGYLYAVESSKTLSEEDADRLFKDFGEFIRGE